LGELLQIFDKCGTSRHHRHPIAAESPAISTNQSQAGNQEDGMLRTFRRLWTEESGQDIAEYAVMLAVILVLVVGTVRLIGSNANNAFSAAASAVQ
jgi:Flp pilus assembly pilin Flp